MHSSRLRWVLPVLLVIFGCKKEAAEAPSGGSPPPAAPAPASPAPSGEASGGTSAPAAPAPAEPAQPAAPFARGSLAVSGEVTLAGAPPEMQPLKRGVDPVCAKKAMNDEQVLSKGGKLENVVVWISEGVPPQAAPAEPAKLAQQDCMYRPRVQAVQDGQTLSVHNGDATLHNVRAARDGKTLFNKAQLPNGPDIAQPVGSGNVLQFKCDVHPWMKAYAVVVSNPFHAVTGEDGKFRIEGLPPGRYTVSAWHELFGTKTAQITLESGKATPIILSYNVQDR